MTRKTFGLALVVAAMATGTWRLTAQTPAYDVIIRNGRIVDGTGQPARTGDVAIKDGRIVAVGVVPTTAGAQRVIDARGLVVSPGFIDTHTHSDLSLLADGTGQSKVRQGVTTDVLGESSSVAPRDGLPPPTGGAAAVQQDWTNFTGYFQRVERQGISMNLISHVSAQQVRLVVMGYDDREATPAEVARMKELVARSMQEGAWGLVSRFESGGPDYPGEIIEMAKVAASYGGNYNSHIGSEGFEQTKELQFALRVAEEAKIPTEIYHLKIRGKDNWGTVGKYTKMINDARAKGLNITANQYPYTAMSHGWSAFFPIWARAGGPAKFAERLVDKEVQLRIKKDKDFNTWAKEHGWWEGIVMSRAANPQNSQYEGMSVAQIAKMRGDADPADTLLGIMAVDGGRTSGIFHTMSEDDVRTVMKQPWVSIASDGSAINLNETGVPHPRNYATNVRVLGYYVRDQHVLTLEDAVRKMSGLPAEILGLKDRELIKPGLAADLAIFDLDTVGETNTFDKPKSYAKGVPYVLVNGVLVIDKGQHTNEKPGKVLRGPGFKASSATSAAR